MIRQLVALSLRFRVLTVGVAAVVIGLGVLQLRGARVDALPEFAPPMVTVQAEAVGLSAGEVEQLVTLGLEQDLLNGVPWVDHMESESAPGYCRVDLYFKPGTDFWRARQAVQERLTQAYVLPAVGLPPVMLQPLSSTSRVMMIGLSSKNMSLTDLSVLARWRLKPRLMGVPGVADVSIWGQRDRQMQVQVDADKLRQNGITLDQVINTTGNALFVSPLGFLEASTPGTGGFVDTATQRLAIQHVLPVTTAKDLSEVTIEDTKGRVLRLSDVATVVQGHQPFLVGDAVLRSGPGLMLVVQKTPDASTQDVTRGIDDALAAMRPGLTGITIDTQVYRAQSYVDTALHDLGVTGLISLLLLLLVIGFLLYSWRVALISIASVLLSVVAASYVLYLTGTGFNLLVLAGLAMALGVIVDDAVVDAGAIRARLLARRVAGEATSLTTVLAEASASVRGPLLYATLAALLAPVPLVFLDGVAGSFSRSALLAYAIAVCVSTVVALVVVPALASLLLTDEPATARVSPVVRLAHGLFDRTVARRVVNPRWAYAVVAALLATGVALVPMLTTRASLPTPHDRSLLVHWEAVPGTSVQEMDRVTGSASNDLRTISGVQDVGAHVGRAYIADEAVDVNTADMWVTLSDSADYDATVASVRRMLDEYPGLRTQIETYTQERVDAIHASSGTGSDVTVRVYGIDADTLTTTAEKLSQKLNGIPGLVDPTVQFQPEQPTLQVEVDLAAAQRYGLVPGDVRRAASAMFSGILVGSLYQDQRIFDVIVWSGPEVRHTPTDLADLRIDTPSGSRVRLGDLATVRIVPYPTVLRHHDSSRYVDIDAQVNGRDVTSVLADVRGRIAATPMPFEYHAEVVSDLSTAQAQDRTMLALGVGAAVVVFLLLQAAFGSWLLAALGFGLLPLALVGGLAGDLLAGGDLSIPAQLGLFLVLGVALRQVIVLVSAYRGGAGAAATPADRAALVLRITRERIGSVLLTVLALGAVFVPVIVAGGNAGFETIYPMAAVVLGGLISSTLVVLLVLPTLYLRFAPAVALGGPDSLWDPVRHDAGPAVTDSGLGEA